MIEYIFVFIVVGFLGFLADLSNHALLKKFFLIFLIFAFLPMYYLRDYTIGTDTLNYIPIFESIFYLKYPIEYAIEYNIEIGFVVVVYILGQFTHNYFFIFTILTFLVYFNLIFSFSRYKLSYILYISSFFSTFAIYFYTYNILRQAIALSFALFAVRFLLDKKNNLFLLFCFFAFLFHYSSLIILLYYFLYKYRKIIVGKWFVFFPCFIIFPFFVFNFLVGVFDKYLAYATSDNISDGSGILLKIFYIFTLFLIIYLRKFIIKNKTEYDFFISVYMVFVSLILFFELSGLFNQGLVRLALYFQWPILFVFLIVLINIQDRNLRYTCNFLFFSFLVFFTTYLLSNYGYEVVPYRMR